MLKIHHSNPYIEKKLYAGHRSFHLHSINSARTIITILLLINCELQTAGTHVCWLSKVATAGLSCVTRRTNLGHAHLLSLSPAAEKRCRRTGLRTLMLRPRGTHWTRTHENRELRVQNKRRERVQQSGARAVHGWKSENNRRPTTSGMALRRRSTRRQRRALLSSLSLPVCSRGSQVTTWTCARARWWKGQSAASRRRRGSLGPRNAPTHPPPTRRGAPQGEPRIQTMESACAIILCKCALNEDTTNTAKLDRALRAKCSHDRQLLLNIQRIVSLNQAAQHKLLSHSQSVSSKHQHI